MEFDFLALWDNKALLAEGFLTTLVISFFAIPISIVMASGIVFMRISKNKTVRLIAASYVEIIRNIPFLIQIFMVFYALPFFGIRLSGLPIGIICLSIYGSAYFVEIFRGGIAAVPRGQFDASKALGLGYFFYMRKVIFPQLLGYIIPPGSNIAITMVKESSLLSMITIAELTYMAHDVNGRTFSPVEVFTTIALLYWTISTALMVLSEWVQKKMQVEEALDVQLIR
jgi:His/Glu/Gln/Arg/opine family amino acid ABC transporter permease subunit